MGRVLTGEQIAAIEHKPVEGLDDDFKASFGEIDDTFSAIFYGESGNGKTNLVLNFCQKLQKLGDILYLGFEEGHAKSFKEALLRSELDLNKIKVDDNSDYKELVKVLERRKSAKIIVIDSIQYMRLTYEQYKQLKRKFMYGRAVNARKIFVFVSHCKGKQIVGKDAFDIRHDCMIKCLVKGYIGDTISRFGKKKNYVVWQQGAKDYWGDKYEQMTCELGKKPRKKTIKKPTKKIEQD
jgi:hypothetical protein